MTTSRSFGLTINLNNWLTEPSSSSKIPDLGPKSEQLVSSENSKSTCSVSRSSSPPLSPFAMRLSLTQPDTSPTPADPAASPPRSSTMPQLLKSSSPPTRSPSSHTLQPLHGRLAFPESMLARDLQMGSLPL